MSIAGIVILCLLGTDPQKCTVEEPVWTEFKATREVTGLGEVLNDIESHMHKGHIYRDQDKITWGHETTHGIHSKLRSKYSQNYSYMIDRNMRGQSTCISLDKINCFYVLGDQVAIVKEPNTTIRRVAGAVPESLRGDIYNLYMLQSSAWNDTPLYIFDEWVAYGNGAAVRHDLKIQNRSETVLYALEMNVYAMTLMYAINSNDKQLKAFFMWNTERTMSLYWKNGPTQKQRDYLEKIRTNPDAKKLRTFMRKYCSPEWTARVLGF